MGYLVVRNDLAPFRTGAPDPVVLHQALDRSPGLRKVASFGPVVGDGPLAVGEDGTRVLTARGRSAGYRAVEVYRTGSGGGDGAGDGAGDDRVGAWAAGTVPVVTGDPGTRLSTSDSDHPVVLAGDARGSTFGGSSTLSDGLRRRETAFTAVRQNRSATMTPHQGWRLGSVEHDHRVYPRQARWETTVRWDGVAGVSSSSSQAYADAPAPVRPEQSPAAALDGNPVTSYVSASTRGARGQWWQVRLTGPTDLRRVRVRLGPAQGAQVTRLALTTAAGTVEVPAPDPRRAETYTLAEGPTTFLRVRALRVATDRPGAQLALGEVHLPGLTPRRLLAPPTTHGPAPARVVLSRAPTRPACAQVGGTTQCDDVWRTRSEDGVTISRRLDLATGGIDYRPRLAARIRSTVAAQRALTPLLPVRVRATYPLSTSPAAGRFALVDQDLGTTWVADARSARPGLSLGWAGRVRVSRIQLALGEEAAASAPTRVRVTGGGGTRVVALDEDGSGTFAPLLTSRLRVDVLRSRPAYSREAGSVVRLPVGVSEVRLPGAEGVLPSPYARVDLGCGSGPTLRVDGSEYPTSLLVSLRDLAGPATVPARFCGAQDVTLYAGRTDVDVEPSAFAVPERLELTAPGGTVAPVQVPVRVERWDAQARTVRLPATDRPTLLVTGENLNAGWRATLGGRTLAAQRVDGWRQGWVVPAGDGGRVELAYTPDRPYRLALGAGLLGVLVVGAVAWWSRRTRAPALVASTGAGWVDVVVVLGVGGLLAGWAGLAVAAVALVLQRVREVAEPAGWLAAALVASGGGVLALLRSDGFAPHSTTAQALALLGLAVAVAGANGPTVRSRIRRRSNV